MVKQYSKMTEVFYTPERNHLNTSCKQHFTSTKMRTVSGVLIYDPEDLILLIKLTLMASAGTDACVDYDEIVCSRDAGVIKSPSLCWQRLH